MIALNSAMASQLIDFRKEVGVKMEQGIRKEEAIFDTLRTYIRDSKPHPLRGEWLQ